MKQRNGEEIKAKGAKAENESVLLSHKEKKFTSDSSIETVPLEELKNKKKSSTGRKSDPELQETTVSESKLCLSETRKGKNTLSEEEKYGGSARESKKLSDCVDKEPGTRSKLLPLSLGKQSTSTKPPGKEQLGEKRLKSCRDKDTRKKDCNGQNNGEMTPMSKEDTHSPAGAQSVSKCAALRGRTEAELPKAQLGPRLPQSPGEASASDSDKEQFVCSSSGESKPEKSVEISSGKSGKSVEGTSLPRGAASYHMEGPQDPEVLHNCLLLQLKQKKVIIAPIIWGGCCSVFKVISVTHDRHQNMSPHSRNSKWGLGRCGMVSNSAFVQTGCNKQTQTNNFNGSRIFCLWGCSVLTHLRLCLSFYPENNLHKME